MPADDKPPSPKPPPIEETMTGATETTILMVTHNWGGGTEKHVQEVSQLLEDQGERVLICRPLTENPSLLKVRARSGEQLVAAKEIDLRRDPSLMAGHLKELGVTHVHVHSLVGYEHDAPDFLRLSAAVAGIPYDVTIHDSISFCPRIFLADRSGAYCGEPDADTCARCVQRDSSPFGRPAIWDWRARYERLLRNARCVFAPSHSVASRIERHFPSVTVTVRPHPEVTPQAEPEGWSPAPLDPEIYLRPPHRRIAVLGVLAQHKGAHLVLETATASRELEMGLDFVVIGSTDRDEAMSGVGNVQITGRYEEWELPDLIARVDPDAFLFPSVVPETFSYTLSEAFRTQRPCFGFDFGAIGERLLASPLGVVLPYELILDPVGLARSLATAALPARQQA